MYPEPEPYLYRRAPKVPFDRRAYAFLLDFVTVWLISSFFQGVAQAFVFVVAWGVMRIVVVEKNKGQSLGRWAFDIRLIDLRLNATPGLLELSKREGVLCIAALMAMEGLNINFNNGLSMILLILPLIIDCSVALGDDELNQAFHDRIAQTQVVQTRRGYSLDLRFKKWWVEIRKSLPRQDRR